MTAIDRPMQGRNDAYVMAALEQAPGWIGGVLDRLDGYPSRRCWVWSGTLNTGGYADVALPRWLEGFSRKVRVHRAVWLALRGAIPEGLVLDHGGHCGNRACANPDHLEAVTPRHNTIITGKSMVAQQAAQTHCLHGHPLVGDNLFPSALVKGRRACRACGRVKAAIHARALSDAAAHLGLTVADYKRRYGQSKVLAMRILGGEVVQS